jgi:hypothetical protein
LDYLTNHTSLSPIRRGFSTGFVNYKKGCTRLAAASDKVYQLLAHGQWFSPGTSTTKTGCDDIAEILLKAALNTIIQISKNTLNELSVHINYIDKKNQQKFTNSTKYSKNIYCLKFQYLDLIEHLHSQDMSLY